MNPRVFVEMQSKADKDNSFLGNGEKLILIKNGFSFNIFSPSPLPYYDLRIHMREPSHVTKIH